MNSIEELIREKLKIALETQKREIASALLSTTLSHEEKPIIEAKTPKGIAIHNAQILGYRFDQKDGNNSHYKHPDGHHLIFHSGMKWSHKNPKDNGYATGHASSLTSYLKKQHPEYVREAFGRTGRPTDNKPSDNAGERRQKLQMKIMKDRAKVQKIQSQAAQAKDARKKNADLQIARTQLSLDTQKLANHR